MMWMDIVFVSRIYYGHGHLGSQVLVMIGRRYRKIAHFITRTIAKIVLLPAGIPPTLLGIDEIVPLILLLIEAHVVEDEEFGFRAEIRRVSYAGRNQIHLGFFGDVARITVIALLGHGIDD